MAPSHFDSQLLPGERVLWQGQPDKEAFARGGRCLVNWVVGSVIAWAVVFSADFVSRHGIPGFLHGGVKIPAVPLVLALLTKVVFIFAPSSAGNYWYAITNQRIFAEFPDEGSQTTIILNLGDVTKVSLRQKGNASGTVVIVAKAYRESKVYFQDIADAAEVCGLFAGITSRPASV